VTNKVGVHVWDDWLNRLDGKPIKDRYTFTRSDEHGHVIQSYTKRRIDTARPVVCDPCNHEWMSDLTNDFKRTAQGIIRHGYACSLLPLGIATVAAFAFMKTAVIDLDNPKPYFNSGICHHFRNTRRVPRGVQIWLASYRSPKRFETHVATSSSMLKSGPFSGYQFYVFTYLVGHLVIQLTFPRWTRFTRRHPPLPAWIPDRRWMPATVDLYPGVHRLTWPPTQYLDREGVQQLRNRLNTSNDVDTITSAP
jgi:hypothetical protein